MCDRLHHAPRRGHGQLRVGIQCNDVADRKRKATRKAHLAVFLPRGLFSHKPLPSKQGIEIFQLAAFSLSSNPSPLTLGPSSLPVEKEESLARILRVQLVD